MTVTNLGVSAKRMAIKILLQQEYIRDVLQETEFGQLFCDPKLLLYKQKTPPKVIEYLRGALT